MANIQHVGGLSQLQSIISGSIPVSIIDFHAEWCGPCKTIAPVFARLAGQYANQMNFIKVDVDKAQDVAAMFQVSAMPTFVVLKGMEPVDVMRGANPAGLEAIVRKHASSASSGSASSSSAPVEKGLDGFSVINSAIEASQVSCLNESSSHTVRHLLKGGGDSWLESDADEQLLIHFPTQASRIRAIRFKTVDSAAEQAPKTVKLFVNNAHLGFDDVESLEAAQEITLTEKQAKGEEAVQTRFVRFQNVTHLAIFVNDNQGGGDVTRIDRLELIGTLVNGTEMKDFKKLGEE